MYLVAPEVISEARKGDKANRGVRAFFSKAARDDTALYLSVITIGELRQGVENIRRRGDKRQADPSGTLAKQNYERYADAILPFDRKPHRYRAVCEYPSGELSQ